MKLLRRVSATLIMLAFDAAGLAAGFLLAYVLRLTLLMDLFPSLLVPLSFDAFAQRFYLLAVYLLVFAYEGLYTRRLVFWEETRRILRGTVLATILVVMALYVTRSYVLSRSVVLTAMFLGFAIIPFMRTLAKQLVIGLRLWSKSVIIVGQDRNARILRTELARNWRLGYKVAAVVDPGQLQAEDPNRIQALLRTHQAESFVLSDASVGREQVAQLLGSGEAQSSEVMVLLDRSTLRNAGVEVEQLESLLLMKYRYNLLQPVNDVMKRVVDIILTILLGILLLPLIVVVGLFVRLSSTGPVFYVQQRIGRGGRLFACQKFRTMWQDADIRLERMLAASPALREEWMKYSRITDDPRVTRTGRLLRRFSLDELPQIWNVLCGDMSWVGPRPYMPCEMEKIGSFLGVITRVRPGITGPFQTSGRKELTFDERLMLDEHYVRNWSLWTDFALMLRTIKVVLTGRGAL